MRYERQPRRSVNVGVLTVSGEKRGEGRLVNISLSGALIESSALHPGLGAPVTISAARESVPGEIVGTVARQVLGGFAVHFAETTPLVHRLVEQGNLGRSV